jgi:hypothetical protein
VKAGTRRTDGRGRLRIPCRRLPARVHRRQRRRVGQGETAVPVLLSFFFFFCWKLSFFRPLYKNEDTGVLRNSLVFAMWTILLPDWREICVFDALSLCTIVHLVSFTCN